MAKSKATMISQGKTKYVAGIKAIGGAKEYYACGAKGGMDTAVCLAGLREALSEEDWGSKWESAMSVK